MTNAIVGSMHHILNILAAPRILHLLRFSETPWCNLLQLRGDSIPLDLNK